MISRLAEALLVWLAALHVASSTLSIRFERSENEITLECREAGMGDLQNAIFLGDDDEPLNDKGTNEFKFNITNETEGNFTCHEQGRPTPVSGRLQLAAIPELYNGPSPKTLYVRRGDVTELPCDYQPGRARSLYDVSWVRGGLTELDNPPAFPHLRIDPDSYSLFLVANETARTLDGINYHCAVDVTGCGGVCSAVGPITLPGADITIKIIEPLDVVVTSDTNDTITGQEVGYSCVAHGDNIPDIVWTVNDRPCSPTTNCSLKLDDVMPSSRNSAITLSTGGLTGEVVVECIAVQTFRSEQADIIDPGDPQRLVNEVEFQRLAEAVTITVRPLPVSTLPPSPTLTSSTSATLQGSPTPTLETPTSSDGSFKDIHIIIIVIGVVVVAVVAIVMGSVVIIYCKKYNGKGRSHRIPSSDYPPSSGPISPAHGSNHPYPDQLDFYDPRNDNVFAGGRDLEDSGVVPPEYFKSGFEYDRQVGIPYDTLFSDKGSMARFPFYNEDRLSQCLQDSIYNSSQASGTSGGSVFKDPGVYQTSKRSSYRSRTSRSRSPEEISYQRRSTGSRSPGPSPHYDRTSVSSRSPRASYHGRRSASRSPGPLHHNRTSMSRSPRAPYLDRTMSRSPRSSYHDRRSASRSPGTSPYHDRPSRSRSPGGWPYHERQSRFHFPGPTPHNNRTSRSPSPRPSPHHDRNSRSPSPRPSRHHHHRSPSPGPYHGEMSRSRSPGPPHAPYYDMPSGTDFPQFVNGPSPSHSAYYPPRHRSHSPHVYVSQPLEQEPPPESPASTYQPLQEDAARRSKEEMLLEVISQLMHPEDCPFASCSCKGLKEKFVELRARLPQQQQCERTPSERPTDMGDQMRLAIAAKRPLLKRQRSRSCDLTPIQEQPEFPSPVGPRNAGTPNGHPGIIGRVDGKRERPPLLREISISAENLPFLFLNDKMITPSPLREYRSLASAALSPQRDERRKWVARSTMETLPERRHSVESSTSDESNTSSRTGTANGTIQSDGDASDAERTPVPVTQPALSKVAPRKVLHRLPTSLESGYESPGYTSEGSQPGSGKLQRKLGQLREMSTCEESGVGVQETLC